MGYFQVRYDSRVANYDCRGFIRLATGLEPTYSDDPRSNPAQIVYQKSLENTELNLPKKMIGMCQLIVNYLVRLIYITTKIGIFALG